MAISQASSSQAHASLRALDCRNFVHSEQILANFSPIQSNGALPSPIHLLPPPPSRPLPPRPLPPPPKPSKTPSTIHGLKPHPLLGHLPHFLSNRHRILDWFTETLLRSPTHTISLRILGGAAAAVVTADPRNVEHMLRARFDNYPKGAHSASMLHDLLGRGIFNSDGDPWRRQRKAASFEFSRRSLRAFVVDAVQSELAERLLPLLEKAEEDGDVVDLQKVLERFSFDNICKVAFGEDPGCLSAEGFAGRNFEFMQAFEEAQNIVIGRFMSPVMFHI
uniref:Uncharacterized protein n=1 Tax=Ananas comosus var. bracteatus TaxID=296719 RepID=A0A6V7PFH3_ANACO|nr:unnamed protein product [Ananas comosus var. bracteatus]